MHVLIVLGTRPEAIKLAPVIVECLRRDGIRVTVCSTGQHREMLDQALSAFGLSPDISLDLMIENQSLASLTARAITEIDLVIQETSPDVTVVQGDTTTAMCAALASFYRRVPVMHVEAGLRTFDRFNPFPEEANRVFIDQVADWCMAPTEKAAQNLRDSGVSSDRIEVTGNTSIDALLSVVARVNDANAPIAIPAALAKDIVSGKRIIVVTGHRRESFGADLEQICLALADIASANPDVAIAYPVHLNPNVQGPVRRILGSVAGIHLFDPLPYPDFVWLLTRSHIVLTDSGGIQEEVPSLNKPVLVMRRVTERGEGVEAGCARLVGVERKSVRDAVQRLLGDQDEYREMASAPNPYGDGRAAARIADCLERMGKAVV